MNETNLDTLTLIDKSDFEKFLLEPYELIIPDKETPKDISDWEDLYNELFVNHFTLFTLEKKKYIIRFKNKQIIENDKINNTNNYTIFYTKHEKLIKKIIANSENSLQK